MWRFYPRKPQCSLICIQYSDLKDNFRGYQQSPIIFPQSERISSENERIVVVFKFEDEGNMHQLCINTNLVKSFDLGKCRLSKGAAVHLKLIMGHFLVSDRAGYKFFAASLG